MDNYYYHSLKLKYEFKKEKRGKDAYQTKMNQTTAYYFCGSCDEITGNLYG
jgi:hypothetical protein